MARLKGFVRGSSTYKCRVCTRLTRATSGDHIGADKICAECWELAGIENGISDYGMADAIEHGYIEAAKRHLKSLKSINPALLSHWDDLMATIGVTAESL